MQTAKEVVPKASMTKQARNYLSMIVECIILQDERGGVSREAIWKTMVMKFPEATSNERGRKIYLARLKKLADEGNHITYGKNRARFQLNKNFRT